MIKHWNVWIRFTLLPFISALFLCLSAELPRIRSGDVGGAVGGAIGLMLFPALVAYAVRGRKGNWKSFGRWFFWGTVLCLWSAFYGKGL